MEWWMWTGGIIGAIFVAGTAALVSRLGGAVLFTVIILGQLVGAVILDNYGWFGVDKNPISMPRIAGVLLVIVGAVIVRRS
jgi:transporter family-2 protein